MNERLQIPIDDIVIKGRIRKDLGNINELAADIQENGLIQPPVVTPEYVLIAGERRIRACQFRGFTKIEVRVMKVWDYEHHLKLEISENEQRKELTDSERIAYAREVERIEAAKAAERQIELAGTRPNKDLVVKCPQGDRQIKTRDIVAKTVGFGSGKTYERAKYAIEHGSPETISKLDTGEISVNKAYQEAKQQREDNKKVVPLKIKLPDKALVARKNAECLAKQKPVFGTPEDLAIKKTLDDMTAMLANQFNILRSQIYDTGDIHHLQHVIRNGADALRITAREIEDLVDIQIKTRKEITNEKISYEYTS